MGAMVRQEASLAVVDNSDKLRRSFRCLCPFPATIRTFLRDFSFWPCQGALRATPEVQLLSLEEVSPLVCPRQCNHLTMRARLSSTRMAEGWGCNDLAIRFASTAISTPVLQYQRQWWVSPSPRLDMLVRNWRFTEVLHEQNQLRRSLTGGLLCLKRKSAECISICMCSSFPEFQCVLIAG